MSAACGETCRATLESSANTSMGRSLDKHAPGAPGRMLAADHWPSELASHDFPPIGATCPHGVKFWTYPDANLIEALTQMNEGRYLGGDA